VTSAYIMQTDCRKPPWCGFFAAGAADLSRFRGYSVRGRCVI